MLVAKNSKVDVSKPKAHIDIPEAFDEESRGMSVLSDYIRPSYRYSFESDLSKNASNSHKVMAAPQQLSKEEFSEYVADRVMRYITHELTHGENFFRELTSKFSELFRKTYQPYNPTSPTIYTLPLSSKPVSYKGNLLAHRKPSPSTLATTTSSLTRTEEEDKSNPGKTMGVCLLPKKITADVTKKACLEVKEYIELLEILIYQLAYSFIEGEFGGVSQNFDKKLKVAVHAVVFYPDYHIYETTFTLIEKQLGARTMQTQQLVQSGKHLRPEDFNVDENFCLPEEEVPYLSATEVLSMTNKLYSPEEKMRIICYTKNEIIKAVDSYWRSKDPHKTASELAISADQLLPIYSYIVARATNASIKANMLFIESFLDSYYLKFGEEAYFFATLSVATSYLSSSKKLPSAKPYSKGMESETEKDTSVESKSQATRSSMTFDSEEENGFRLAGISERDSEEPLISSYK